MTTYQDPPPQSRRAARNSERAESAHTPTPFEAAAEMWDTNSRRAAGLTPAAPRADAPATGRRAAPAPSGEPLGYVTQQRAADPAAVSSAPAPTGPGAPTGVASPAPQFRPRGTTPQPTDSAPSPPQAVDAAPTAALPVADQPRYRLRDYSPDGTGRRAAPSPAPEWTQPYDPTLLEDADLSYRTERRAPVTPQPVSEVPAQFLPSGPGPVEAVSAPTAQDVPAAIVPDSGTSTPERTLTRREMRALVEAEQADAASGPLPLVAPEPKPTTGLTNAISEFDALMARAAAAAPMPVEAPVPPSTWQAEAPAERIAPEAPTSAPEYSIPQTPVPQPVQPPQDIVSAPAAPASAPPSEPMWPVFDDVLTAPELAPQARTEQPSAAPSEAVTDDRSRLDARAPRPSGHWAAQLDADGDEIMETTVNRTIGAGTVTTNALVLPTTPDTDIRGPLTSTGEILLTGSIDLPASLASTGVTSRIENSGMDHLFETHDAEVVSTDSKPVSAIRAVSTQSGSGLSHAPKSRGNRALTALLIAAVGMGVVVVGLLGLALAFGAFS